MREGRMRSFTLNANFLVFSSLFNIATASSYNPVSPIASRIHELVLHRDTSTARCSLIQSHETQTHRRLAPSYINPSAHVIETSMRVRHDGKGEFEEIKVFGHSEDVLWDVVEKETGCGGFGEVDLSWFIRGEDEFEGTSEVANSAETVYASIMPGQDVLSGPKVEVGSQSRKKLKGKVRAPPMEITKIMGSGASENRVDLTFFSDGYLESEKQKFIDDVTWLVDEIAGNQTFHTVAPLLNFWAAFTPSNETGVGVGGKPKETPYGLYRDGTELRALYYAYPEVGRAACQALGDKCNYPILIGNDPLYGGLGGEFTTITPSVANGPLILRHELGHSVIRVGEEYDGGFAYFGPNAGHDLSELPWTQWLTKPLAKDTLIEPRVERSVMPLQAYPWTLLNTTEPWSTTFLSSGTYSRYLVRFSLSGLPEKGDVSVLFDSEDLGWEPKEGLGMDRYHYDIYRDGTLSEGEHEVKFVLNTEEREGVAQLCNVEILEFGSDPDEFNSTAGFYGVFPTFSEKNETSYRPTNEDCLMRIVTTPNFCSACVEGLWHSLLKRVDLIDNITTACQLTPFGTCKRTFELSLVPIGQFREDETNAAESYKIEWKKDGKPISGYENETVLEVSGSEGGEWEVEVMFETEEVRVDPEDLLMSWRGISVDGGCV